MLQLGSRRRPSEYGNHSCAVEILAWASLLVAVFVRQCMREVEFAAARQQDAAK